MNAWLGVSSGQTRRERTFFSLLPKKRPDRVKLRLPGRWVWLTCPYLSASIPDGADTWGLGTRVDESTCWAE